MNRRSLDKEGWVNFPTHLPNSGEGGMLVKLWVLDRRDTDAAYGVCTGVGVFDVITESFLGTDKSPPPSSDFYENHEQYSPEELRKLDDEHQKMYEQWADSFYDKDTGNVGFLLASIVLGSTGWSNSEFRCKPEDLTEEGKQLYNLMQRLYPDAELHLATFLDT